MSKEELFTININELDNPFEREKFLMLPQDLLVELLVRHLKREIKAIEYIKNASYFDGSSMCANDLLEILEENNNE